MRGRGAEEERKRKMRGRVERKRSSVHHMKTPQQSKPIAAAIDTPWD